MSKIKSIREIEMERAAQPNFGKGITVASGFDLGAKAPLDSRATVKTLEERNAHLTGNRAYEGMLVYVEADKKTYQLVDGQWKVFGFDSEQFESNVEDTLESDSQTTALSAKQGKVLKGMIDAQSNQLSTVDGKVDANTQSITQLDSKLTTAEATIAKNTAAIEKEIKDREASHSDLGNKISELDAAYKNADTTINSRLDALEGKTADLEQVRTDITANTSAIAKEVQDRTQAVNDVDSKLTAEVSRATAAEGALGSRIDGVEASVEEVRSSVDTKTAQALKDAKAYTDEKVVEINAANEALKTKVEANEAALGTVDTRIATAKGEAINTSNAHTTSEIAKIDAAYKAADAQVLSDAKAHAEAKVQEAKTALEGSISVVDGKIASAKAELQGNIDTLADRVSTNESEISKLKDAVSNKNSNTIVVETEGEIATANANPKVGDMAYVISTKRAYIFKGVDALSAKAVPQGWVVFDEITSELDLVNYLKKSEADTTYRKLADKIAEADLATELVSKIDSKLDGTQVDSKISAAVNTVNEKVVANTAAITQEVADRKSEITRVEGALNSAKTELNSSISSVNSKVDTVKSDLTSSLTEKETALKAEDTRLNNRINKFVPVVAEEEPTETEAGHVWLQLV